MKKQAVIFGPHTAVNRRQQPGISLPFPSFPVLGGWEGVCHILLPEKFWPQTWARLSGCQMTFDTGVIVGDCVHGKLWPRAQHAVGELRKRT